MQGDLLNKVGAVRQGLPELNRANYLDAATVCEAVAPAQATMDKAALLGNAKPLSVTNQLMAKPAIKSAQACSEAAISTRVNDWADAWRHKDYESYIQFYADNFTPEPPLSREAWAKQRKQRLATSGKINLNISNLKVTCDGDKAVATFNQDYSVTTYKMLRKQSAGAGCEVCAAKRVATKGFADKVNKTLNYAKNNSCQWQIVQEITNK